MARAIALAAAASARIRIVHAATASEVENACSSTHGRMLREARIMAEEITDRPPEITGHIGFQSPAESILKEAEAWDADIIVLGAHGEPRFRDALFGTTGTCVVRHSDRPVLIVQNDFRESYSRVLVAVDDTIHAGGILDAVREVAPSSELFAVHAFYPSLGQALAGRDSVEQEERRHEAELERQLAEATGGRPAARLTASRHAVVETGEALSVVMRETAKIAPDLLAMGTRRRATYLGSHAIDTLFWCPHDILVVPERVTAGVGA